MSTLWTDPERELLSYLAGQHPWSEVTRTYRQEAARRGWPRRTNNALSHEIHAMGMTRVCNGKKWISPCILIAMTGREKSFTKTLVSRGVRRRGHSAGTVLNRQDILELARTDPAVFGGISRGGLLQLLESEELADRISTEYPRVPRKAVRIYIEQLGITFPSIRAAAARIFVDPSTITRALADNRDCLGYTVRIAP